MSKQPEVKKKTKQPKPAHVSIRLPDGTKIEADGPMAEAMARRLMHENYLYSWPNGWWYNSNFNDVYGIRRNTLWSSEGQKYAGLAQTQTWTGTAAQGVYANQQINAHPNQQVATQNQALCAAQASLAGMQQAYKVAHDGQSEMKVPGEAPRPLGGSIRWSNAQGTVGGTCTPEQLGEIVAKGLGTPTK